jgi:hypothetical protein
MSQNFSQGSIQPLSIGNVVSAGLRLYRSHLKTYFQLAAIANLWILVPVYGWAKYCAIGGLISRLAFNDLIGKPESVSEARHHTNPRLWSFLGVAFRVGLSLLLVYLGAVILAGIVAGVLGVVLSAILGPLAIVLVTIVGIIIALGAIIWYFSRWVVAEVPLAVEEDVNGGESVNRSWELTKASVVRIQGVVLVAFLVTLPLIFLTSYLPQIFLVGLEAGSSTYWIVYFLSFVTSLIGGALVMPFWQALKAVIYYDLRNRREGLGLQLRDRPI